jgi:hypothetical protein
MKRDGICGQISKLEFFKINIELDGTVRFMNEFLDSRSG